MLLLVTSIAINWPYQYAAVGTAPSGQIDSQVDFKKQRQNQIPVMGGWPTRYLVAYPSIHSGKEYRYFSLIALLGNVAIAASVMGIVLLYMVRRQRRIHAGKLAKGSLNIADLLIATFLLAAPFAWWQRAGQAREDDIALQQQIAAAGGAAVRNAWLPEVLVQRVPTSLTQQLQRLREVRLEEATNVLVAKLVDHGHLTTVRLGGGDYDLRLLDKLVSNPHVSDLRVAGRVVDTRTLQAIAAHRHLDTLNLMRTNVSSESLALLGPLRELQRLNLVHSDVALKDLNVPEWSDTIRELDLPHPLPGDRDSLLIDGWPQLEMLRINELDTLRNPVPMVVVLKNLPSLKNLQLDNFQKFDLTLHNIPLLEQITNRFFEWRSRIPRGGTAPGSLWCSRFIATQMAKLRTVNLFCLDLKDFQVRDCPKYTGLGVVAFYRTVTAATYAPKLDPDAAEQLIRGIGSSEGPRIVNLDSVPLQGVDLSPLSKNEQLTELLLSKSGTSIKQWRALEPMKWLTRFDIKDCKVDEKDIQWALDSFPKLRHFAFSPITERSLFEGKAVSLEIVDRENLQTIDFGDTPIHFLENVRIENTPKLAIPLKLGYVHKLRVTNAPRITGLSLESPPPFDADVSGFEDLQFLAVGGPSVTDRWIDAIADCAALNTLTLAYPAVTAEGLTRLKLSPSLASLSLPGTSVDDQVVAAWPELDQLVSLDLSDTMITGTGLSRVIKSPFLRHLAIRNTQVKPADLVVLKDKTQLLHLNVGGVGLDASTLGEVLFGNSITRLDLSDSVVTPEALDAISQHGSNMMHLALRNCELDNDRLTQIVRQYPHLTFDLSGSTVSTQLMTYLVSQGRMVESAELDQHLAMQQMMSATSPEEYVVPERPALIDVASFAEIAKQSAGQTVGGMPMFIAPGVITTSPIQLPPNSTSAAAGKASSAAAGKASSGPVATRLGRWLGGLMTGVSTDQIADETPDEPSMSDENRHQEPEQDRSSEDAEKSIEPEAKPEAEVEESR